MTILVAYEIAICAMRRCSLAAQTEHEERQLLEAIDIMQNALEMATLARIARTQPPPRCQ